MFGVVEPIFHNRLGVEISDLRSHSEDEQTRIRSLWHSRMQEFLRSRRTFTFQDTCINDACLADLQNAYVDHVEAERAARREPLTWEAFSAANFDRVGIPDYISKPHLGISWFAVRMMNEELPDGVICISNVQQIRGDEPGKMYFEGWPSPIPPRALNFTTGAGELNRFMMDTDLILLNERRLVDFVEWTLPTHSATRYVDRGDGNDFGAEVFRIMGNGLRVKFEDATLENAPSRVKRELRPTDDPAEFPEYTRAEAQVESDRPLAPTPRSQRP